jgi:hypothetical protein
MSCTIMIRMLTLLLTPLAVQTRAADPVAKPVTPVADTFQLAAPGTVRVQGWLTRAALSTSGRAKANLSV